MTAMSDVVESFDISLARGDLRLVKKTTDAGSR
jgi:hypothetical protein